MAREAGLGSVTKKVKSFCKCVADYYYVCPRSKRSEQKSKRTKLLLLVFSRKYVSYMSRGHKVVVVVVVAAAAAVAAAVR